MHHRLLVLSNSTARLEAWNERPLAKAEVYCRNRRVLQTARPDRAGPAHAYTTSNRHEAAAAHLQPEVGAASGRPAVPCPRLGGGACRTSASLRQCSCDSAFRISLGSDAARGAASHLAHALGPRSAARGRSGPLGGAQAILCSAGRGCQEFVPQFATHLDRGPLLPLNTQSNHPTDQLGHYMALAPGFAVCWAGASPLPSGTTCLRAGQQLVADPTNHGTLCRWRVCA
jgi:hypothetical protein